MEVSLNVNLTAKTYLKVMYAKYDLICNFFQRIFANIKLLTGGWTDRSMAFFYFYERPIPNLANVK